MADIEPVAIVEVPSEGEQRRILLQHLTEIETFKATEYSDDGYEYEVMPEILTVLDAYHRLAQAELRLIHAPVLGEIASHAGEARAILNRYRRPGSGIAPAEQSEMKAALIHARKMVLSTVGPRLSLWSADRSGIADLISKASLTLDEKTKSLDLVLERGKELAEKLSVAHNADIFLTQSKSDRWAAWLWLAISAAVGGVTLWVASAFYENASIYAKSVLDKTAAAATSTVAKASAAPVAPDPDSTSTPDIASHVTLPSVAPVGASLPQAVLSIAILSILSFAFVATVRTARAFMHSSVMNKHRHNALMTFQAFAESPLADPAAKVALLQYAASAIFTAQGSGFLGGKDAPPVGPAHLLEIVRGGK